MQPGSALTARRPPCPASPCSRLLSNLKYVVVDEGHAYKGEL